MTKKNPRLDSIRGFGIKTPAEIRRGFGIKSPRLKGSKTGGKEP
jgi:hypothetical protein